MTTLKASTRRSLRKNTFGTKTRIKNYKLALKIMNDQSRFKREQPPRLKNLDWYPEPLTKLERAALYIGWGVAAVGTAIVIWSFF
jgi:hypothetical protein